ncbi:DUF4276 family protein [Desulfomonile tiedjei]|uniref:DUF4276 family protein n=1 Tax=Desulfomonile tiedjei (strain ATCC 49306 / DSM 6799 / DCB-1) TaxID=706587 RepID=I4C450_DESTA|nr:DUF4276 family protein [Desulfomonile tiedjei]AFM24341.1 hypothetical protein Desti_1630 [Desulfomonile tiedjei DSM 6799]
MKVLVYVEGPSDKAAMETLLSPLLERKQREGVRISFHEAPTGDRKKSVLLKIPVKAVNILRNDPETMVVALPDLYPKNKGFPHSTPEELRSGVIDQFEKALVNKGVEDHRMLNRFKVFCFKHDMEALLLAAEDSLRQRIGPPRLMCSWIHPVENQNHDIPPKRVVEEVFSQRNQRYRDTVDAPMILAEAEYQDLMEECNQCFRPFVEFLENCRE